MMPRIAIDDSRPRTPSATYPAKAVAGEPVRVSADIFRDGHDILAARARWRRAGEAGAGEAGAGEAGAGEAWAEVAMHEVANDAWEGSFTPTSIGLHHFVVEAWTDTFATWRRKVNLKVEAGEPVEVDLEEGALLLLGRGSDDALVAAAETLVAAAEALRAPCGMMATRLELAMSAEVGALMAGPAGAPDLSSGPVMSLWVDRPLAACGAWYELFPRSEGGLAGATKRLSAVAEMGFDVVYLPPVHPIGQAARKGADNSLVAGPADPGSPWAIGSADGGHEALNSDLGTLDDFAGLVARAHELGMEVALDYALQCSPDHPWVSAHPEWFIRRSDGSVAYAENPPKRYQDIVALDLWGTGPGSRMDAWQACLEVALIWVGRGVSVLRVDNPHTKPFPFWEWLIEGVHAEHPEVIFLAEAFTRPKVMAKLAEVGFSQSYTYFTWRNTAAELAAYATELTEGPLADYMRPTFWPNTPDILAGPLRRGPLSSFKTRLVLAATLSPCYGIYSGYELGENEPASEDNEEYAHSEKYELKHRDWARPDSLAPYVTLVNAARQRHPALRIARNLTFAGSNNSSILAYSRHTDDRSDVVLVVVNLDPAAPQEATLTLDLGRLGLPWDTAYEAADELTGAIYAWVGPNPFVRLEPAVEPAHILHLRLPLR
ncbi:MAG: maltotransferase domain-containing protein [Acidimicrobiales bacterium]